jgi:hypothetical protein
MKLPQTKPASPENNVGPWSAVRPVSEILPKKKPDVVTRRIGGVVTKSSKV